MSAPTCEPCQRFFSRFQCGMAVNLECDCPKCQGLCRCHELEQKQQEVGFFDKFVTSVLNRPDMYGVANGRDLELVTLGYTCAKHDTSGRWLQFTRTVPMFGAHTINELRPKWLAFLAQNSE